MTRPLLLAALMLPACKDNAPVDDTGCNVVWFIDADGDGFGSPEYTSAACEAPEGYVDNVEDCDDLDAGINPTAEEVCDGLDNDCDGTLDEDTTGGEWVYADADGDGFGDPDNGVEACGIPEGYTLDTQDCDDADELVNPEAEEVCNDGVDNNCDGTSDSCTYADNVFMEDADQRYRFADADDQFGAPLRAVGDINGDGRNHLAISARGDDDGAENAGAVYVFSGQGEGSIATSGAVLKLTGEADGDQLYGVHAIGDTDSDGYSDLLVTSQRNDDAGADAGKLYLVPGALQGTHAVADVATVTLLGEAAGDRAGVVTGLGDIDGDGVEDLLVAAQNNDQGGNNAGAAYLLMGPVASGSLADADLKLMGAEGDRAGGGLSGVGDVNGDGLPDFLVGAPYGDAGGDNSGAIYLVTDGSTLSGAVQVADVAAATYHTSADNDEAGWGLSSAGDHDGDGLADFMISAQREDLRENNGNEGGVYLVTQRVSGDVDLSTVHALFIGEAAEDKLASNHGNGDANGDGNPDVLLGSRFQDESGTDAGAAYLVLGPVAAGQYEVEDAAATKFQGAPNEGAGFGAPVHFAGDLNGDGVDDMAFGARWKDSEGEATAGEAYVVFGLGF